jgi:hypothetical protein
VLLRWENAGLKGGSNCGSRILGRRHMCRGLKARRGKGGIGEIGKIQ